MDGDGADRFGAFVNAVAEVVGHADRVRPLRDYCMGLLTPAERKSVEPLAAVTAPSRVSAQHQSLLHFVAQSAWSDARVLAKVLELTLGPLTRAGAASGQCLGDGVAERVPASKTTLRPASPTCAFQ
jgi:SRSO17 transposase